MFFPKRSALVIEGCRFLMNRLDDYNIKHFKYKIWLNHRKGEGQFMKYS